jgi:hypothetical protein
MAIADMAIVPAIAADTDVAMSVVVESLAVASMVTPEVAAEASTAAAAAASTEAAADMAVVVAMEAAVTGNRSTHS